MGKQYNKVIKRRRRLAYIERKKAKAVELSVSKPRVRRAKKVAAPAESAPVAASAE
jgi:hypothetical protein